MLLSPVLRFDGRGSLLAPPPVGTGPDASSLATAGGLSCRGVRARRTAAPGRAESKLPETKPCVEGTRGFYPALTLQSPQGGALPRRKTRLFLPGVRPQARVVTSRHPHFTGHEINPRGQEGTQDPPRRGGATWAAARGRRSPAAGRWSRPTCVWTAGLQEGQRAPPGLNPSRLSPETDLLWDFALRALCTPRPLCHGARCQKLRREFQLSWDSLSSEVEIHPVREERCRGQRVWGSMV